MTTPTPTPTPGDRLGVVFDRAEAVAKAIGDIAPSLVRSVDWYVGNYVSQAPSHFLGGMTESLKSAMADGSWASEHFYISAPNHLTNLSDAMINTLRTLKETDVEDADELLQIFYQAEGDALRARPEH